MPRERERASGFGAVRQLEGGAKGVASPGPAPRVGASLGIDQPTPREVEVLRAIVEHGTAKLAAAALCCSEPTVRWHLRHLRQKSGRHHLGPLIQWAYESEWWGQQPPSGRRGSAARNYPF